MNTVKRVQQALIARGYDLGRGGADGIPGRMTTAAVAAFQQREGIRVKWPGTIGPMTLQALGLNESAADAEPIVLPWLVEARSYLNKHERRDAKELDKALGLDASETPWCGAFVRACMAATLPKEPLPSNPLGARNWLNFGRAIDGPQIGAVVVFWRGARNGWQGHVGLCVGHDRTHVHVLGGNQSDAVTIARIDKARLLGYRVPVNFPDFPSAPLPMTTIQASVTTNEA